MHFFIVQPSKLHERTDPLCVVTRLKEQESLPFYRQLT